LDNGTTSGAFVSISSTYRKSNPGPAVVTRRTVVSDDFQTEQTISVDNGTSISAFSFRNVRRSSRNNFVPGERSINRAGKNDRLPRVRYSKGLMRHIVHTCIVNVHAVITKHDRLADYEANAFKKVNAF